MLNTYIAKIQTTCCSIQGLKYLFKILLYLAVVWYMYFLLPTTFFMLNMTIMSTCELLLFVARKKMLDAILCVFENLFAKKLINSTF